jgi:hypothetical protein
MTRQNGTCLVPSKKGRESYKIQCVIPEDQRKSLPGKEPAKAETPDLEVLVKTQHNAPSVQSVAMLPEVKGNDLNRHLAITFSPRLPGLSS